ncbi:TRAP transporter small permease subunit [Antarctobacter sp.]|uniref:TRAP transporter small permease subunit n=1 Tax=Antarctobacter sp. TaxID=1872577 RepID=UPI003A926E12
MTGEMLGGTQRDPVSLRMLDVLTQTLNVAGSVLIFCLMVLIGADVIGRGMFGVPLKGVPEIVTLSIVAIVFLQTPQVLRSGRLTRSDAMDGLLFQRLPRFAKWLRSVFDLVSVTVVGVILYTTWPIFWRAWDRNEFIGAVGEVTIPTWPVKLAILVGGATLMLQFLACILRRHGGAHDPH